MREARSAAGTDEVSGVIDATARCSHRCRKQPYCCCQQQYCLVHTYRSDMPHCAVHSIWEYLLYISQ